MATFTKDDIYLLQPCSAWVNPIFQFPQEEATGAEIKAYMIDQGGEDFLPWLMGGSVALATEFIEVVGEDVNLDGKHNRTALHWAAINMRPAVITYLLSQGANKNLNDSDHRTPIDLANLSEDPDTIAAMGA